MFKLRFDFLFFEGKKVYLEIEVLIKKFFNEEIEYFCSEVMREKNECFVFYINVIILKRIRNF